MAFARRCASAILILLIGAIGFSGRVEAQIPTTTAVSGAPNPSTVGQSVTFTATVTAAAAGQPGAGNPPHTVTFLDGATTLGTVNVTNGGGNTGTAVLTTAALAVGTHTITANYSGETDCDGAISCVPSSGNTSQVVNPVPPPPPTTSLSSSPNPSTSGQSVTFTARVTGNSPTGTVTFFDGGTQIGSGAVSSGTATVTTSSLSPGSHSITATYGGDTNNAASTSAALSQQVNAATTPVSTATSLSSSPNPSTSGQSVTFTARVTGNSPTGTVTFFDGGTQIGSGAVSSGTATFTTSSLTVGTHSITARYGGDANNAASTASLQHSVGKATDSVKLQQLTSGALAALLHATGGAVAGILAAHAKDDDLTFGGGIQPNGSGFTVSFDPDLKAQPNDRNSLNRFLASPDGRGNKIDDDFSALGYAGAVKAPPRPVASWATPREWLAWVDVRGTDFRRDTFGSDLKGMQVNALAGLTRRLTPNLLVGVLGGYEHFDYSSQAFNGVLKGDGWTTGAYLGWRFAPDLRLDAGAAWSGILANAVAGTAAGNFTGHRWLVSGGVTGTYAWQSFVLEPSARVFALWERENAYTDSLGTLQADRNFTTGRASGGLKVSYPIASSGVMTIAPYAGLYGDYYYSRDSSGGDSRADALAAGLSTIPLFQGWSARATGGITAAFPRGVQLGVAGEFGGIGSDFHIWTLTVRGSVPF